MVSQFTPQVLRIQITEVLQIVRKTEETYYMLLKLT